MFVQMLVLGLTLMAGEPVFAQTSAAIEARPIKMVVLGDSLSAGLGLDRLRRVSGEVAKGIKGQRDRG